MFGTRRRRADALAAARMVQLTEQRDEARAERAAADAEMAAKDRQIAWLQKQLDNATAQRDIGYNFAHPRVTGTGERA